MLNPNQKRFVDEYLLDLNATQAYIRAGYSGNGANVSASVLLANPSIRDAIREKMAAREIRTQIKQDRVLLEYARIAFLDLRKMYDESGNLIPIHQLDDDTAAAIASVDINERTITDSKGNERKELVRKIKFASKINALDSVARHLGMFNDKLNIDYTSSMTEEEVENRIAELKARALEEANVPELSPDRQVSSSKAC